MNVLYLTMNPSRRSTTAPTEGWFTSLRSRELRPVLVSRERGEFHDWADSQGIPAYVDPLPTPDRLRPWRLARSLMRLRGIVRRHAIDLIHCNEQDVYPYGSVLARVLRLPVVVSVHFRMERGFCEWAFGGSRSPDRVFFVSEHNRIQCLPGIDGIVPEKRLRVLWNGIDMTRIQPDEKRRAAFRARLSVDDDTVVLGAACALRPRKQLEQVVEALAGLQGRRCVFALAGFVVPGDEEYVAALLRGAEQTLGPRFRFLGPTDDISGFYNGIDLTVNTSQEEACSISVIESLACGCPVVGYPSLSVDGQVLPDGGEITPQDDVPALAAALDRWIADPTRLRAARPLARNQSGRFDIGKISLQLWDEYHEVLAERGHAPRRAPEGAAT